MRSPIRGVATTAILVAVLVLNDVSAPAMAQVWDQLPDLPLSRFRHVAAGGHLPNGDGRVFVFGGVVFGFNNTAVDAFSPVTGWDPPGMYPDMPNGRVTNPAIATDSAGKIYVIGGVNTPNTLASINVFDPGANTWNAIPIPDMPTARQSAAATFAPDGMLYVIGGRNASGGQRYDVVERYDPANPNMGWVTLNPLPIPLPGNGGTSVGAAIGCDGQIYVVSNSWAGGNCTGLTYSYDIGLNNWTVKAPMPGCLGGRGVVRGQNGRIYAVNDGDYFKNSPGDTRVYSYDSVSDTWRMESDTNHGHNDLAVAMLDDRIYALGGTSKFGSLPGLRFESLVTDTTAICGDVDISDACAGDIDGFQPGDAVDIPFQRFPFDNAIMWEVNNAFYYNGAGLNFDQLALNHTFGHSFVDLPIGQIDLSKPVLLKIELRNWGRNDSIHFQLQDDQMPSSDPGQSSRFGPPMSWGQDIPGFSSIYGDGDPPNTGELMTVDLRDLVATHGSLSGQTIAETMNNLGHLDIYIQDDTDIDYICLSYSMACAEFTPDNILCEIDNEQLTGDFVLTGDLTNLQDIPVHYLLLPQNATSPADVELCFGTGRNVLRLNQPLGNGDSFRLGAIFNDDAIIIKNAQPGDTVCFQVLLADENVEECCTLEICAEMPPCDCLQIDTRFDEITSILVNKNGTMDFTYKFQLTNVTDDDIYHSFLIPNGDETFDPDYSDIFALNGGTPLEHGQSISIKTRIFNAPPGSFVSFLITVHDENLIECCSRDHEVTAPGK